MSSGGRERVALVTRASRELRAKVAAERRAGMAFNPAPEGRPSKRDRRRIIQFRKDSGR